MLGGAVGGVPITDISQVVENLLANRETDLEIWIRPERVGTRYSVEWTVLEYDWEDFYWKPSFDRTHSPATTLRERAWKWLTRNTTILKKKMPTFEVDREPINVFLVDGKYMFKHYFKQDDLFANLRQYYNQTEYRFEVSEEAFTEVRTLLEDSYYDVTVVDNPERFCVVREKYTEHPKILFKASVLQREHKDYNVFLMKDQLSVEQAVNAGATRLVDSNVDLKF